MKARTRCRHCDFPNTFSATYRHQHSPLHVRGRCRKCGGHTVEVITRMGVYRNTRFLRPYWLPNVHC